VPCNEEARNILIFVVIFQVDRTRGNWLPIKRLEKKRKLYTEVMIKKTSIKLIVFRGKRVNNKIILKLIFQVIRRALVHLGFLQISNSILTLEDWTDRFGRNVFHY
jgi:hypothetical protein